MRVVYSLYSRLHCHWAMLGAFKCTGRCCNHRSIISSLTARLRVVAQDPDRTDKHTRGDTPPIKAQIVASLAALINTFPERFLQADSQNAVRTKPCLSGSPKVRQAGTPRYLTDVDMAAIEQILSRKWVPRAGNGGSAPTLSFSDTPCVAYV